MGDAENAHGERLVAAVRGGTPSYTWPAGRDDVWRPVGWTVRLVGRITG